MRIQSWLLALPVLLLASFEGVLSAQAAHDAPLTRDIKIISSAGARALTDACSSWADRNKLVVAIAIIDWGGNLIDSHAMEGAAARRRLDRCPEPGASLFGPHHASITGSVAGVR